MRNRKFSLSVFSILTILYSYLFIVIQLEDYSMIMGSTGLFILLAAVMYITRNVDWYSLGKKEVPPLPL
jgi:inner membrane protein